MIRAAGGARDALHPPLMLPRLEYFDDEAEDELTRMLHEEHSLEEIDDDPLVETQLMPAKHGAKSPTLASHGRPLVPSPYPSAPKQYASGVQKKAIPPPPPPPRASEPSELSDFFAELYPSGEATGSDVHAPINRVGGGPALPSSASLAARRGPWVIPVTPPEFKPFAVAVQEETKKRSYKGSAFVGGILGIACGFLVVSIANGTITQKNTRSALARATVVIDAILARH